MESGGGSNNQDGRGVRIPPDEQQTRIGPAGMSPGLKPVEGAATPGGVRGASEFAAVGAPRTSPFSSGNWASTQTGPPADPYDQASRLRPWAEAGQSSLGPVRCEFLRSVGPDGSLTEAQRTAVPTHRCAAFGDPLPLSLRQQELVCLQRVHVSCPRFVRGTLLASEEQAKPDGDEQRGRGIPVLAVAGIGLFLLALGILFTGLLGFPPFGSGASPTRQPIAGASTSSSPAASPSPMPATATATPVVQASTPTAPTKTPSVSPNASKTAAAPTPVASATWPPGATASRMDLLVPCTDQANCYVYTVRGPGTNGSSVGDTVDGIARYFGVTTSSIYALNPWASAEINPGDKLKIPPPTR